MTSLGRETRRELVGLPAVLSFRDDAEVPCDVKPAHGSTAQWDDVVDVVLDAGISRQASGQFIDNLDRRKVGPRRNCSASSGMATISAGADSGWMRSRVRSILRTQSLSVCVSINLAACAFLFRVCRVTGFALLVDFIAASGVVGAFFLDQLRPILRVANLAGFGIPESVFATLRAHFFSVRGSVGAMLRIHDRAMFRSVRPSDSDGLFAVCPIPSPRLLRSFALIPHLAVSMWRSMMRRTSSAMEMPSRFASRIKNFRCGSVNEIICLVTGVSIPQGIQCGY